MALRELLQTDPYLSGIAILLLTGWAYHLFFITQSATEPPLIKGYFPFLGAGPQILLNPRRYISRARAQHGDIFTVYAFGLRITFVSDPVDGVPGVFRAKSKQMSFRAGLRLVYTKVLGFSPERADNHELNREHFAMIPPYLLSTSAINSLTERFIRYLGADISERATTEGFKEGRVVNLEEWISSRLFFNSAQALYGEGIFDGADDVFRDFKKFDKDFPKALLLPEWMMRRGGFERARNRIQNLLGRKFTEGLKDPSEFVKKRIEIQLAYGHTLHDVGSDLLGVTFALMINSMPISFWFVTLILTSEKYYKPVMDRIRSHTLPNPNLSTGELFDVDGLLGDPLLQACFQETLRLRTQNGSIRYVFEDTILRVRGWEYSIRKGSIVYVPSFLIHYDPEIYTSVNKFQPDRFLGVDLESALIEDSENPMNIDELVRENKQPKFFKRGVPVRHYMMPFGGGENLVFPFPKMWIAADEGKCTGRRFAQNEIIAMGATILYLFEFEDPSGGKVKETAEPAGKRFGVAAEGPAKPYMVKMKLRDLGSWKGSSISVDKGLDHLWEQVLS